MLDTSKQRKGQVLIEIQETERLVIETERDLEYFGGLHRDFAQKILYNPKALWRPGQPERPISVEQYDVRQIPDLRNIDRVFELTDSLREALDKLRALKEERSALGLY